MGKASGVSRRRKKIKSHRYNSSKKLKRIRNRELRKNNGIANDLVREAWNTKRSLKDNMKSMGLAHDPNKLLSGPKFSEKFSKPSSVGDLQQNSDIVSSLHRKLQKKKEQYNAKKSSNNFTVSEISSNNDEMKAGKKSVADRLAEEASKPTVSNFRFGPDNVKFCAYMIEKYGTDYDAMVRDQKNYYQESAGQLRAKIRKFLANSSHRKVYESAKKIVEAELGDEDDEDDEMED